MKKRILALSLLIIFGFFAYLYAQQVSISTFYPSPFGSYTDLEVVHNLDVNGADATIRVTDTNGIPQIFLDNPITGNVWTLLVDGGGWFGVGDFTNTTGPFRIQSAAPNDSLVINNAGNVGIGTAAPTFPLHVMGQAAKTGGASVEHWANASDYRFKNILGTIDSALDKIKKLNPVRYTWNDFWLEKNGISKDDNPTKYGFTAQELATVFPEFTFKDPEGYFWTNTGGLEAVVFAAVQELEAKNNGQLEELKTENEILRGKIDKLAARIKELEEKL